ncbi:MAG: hypothetical protein LBE10_06905, partial [Treponema sp.]|nr:hypothetical protein [Treponema sp.]
MTDDDGALGGASGNFVTNEFRDVAWGGGKFVAVGGRLVSGIATAGKIAYSSDGVTWTVVD